MSELPRFIRSAPSIFYGAAAFYFIGSVVLLQVQIGSMPMPEASDANSLNVRGVVRATILNGWLQAAYGALLLFGLGVISRILLAIASSRSVASVFDARGASHEDTH